jgi:hypothetical protein
MRRSFFVRLRKYFLEAAKVLRGEADVASIFQNTTDIGTSREKIYSEFLKQHLPSKCNISFGGFLFDENGNESKQLDIIVTTNTVQRFNFHNKDGAGKIFSNIEGTLGVVSVKTRLGKSSLYDGLQGIASIPNTKPLGNRVNPLLSIKNYDEWPLKVIYATEGIVCETLLSHVNEFYNNNPAIPLTRRPEFIHVSGKYLLVRTTETFRTVRNDKTGVVTNFSAGIYHSIITDPDLQAILWVLHKLQEYAAASTHILFSYQNIIEKVNEVSNVI